MKKILFLLIAIFTLSFVTVKADVAPPAFEPRYVEITLDDSNDATAFMQMVTNVKGVVGVQDVYFRYEDSITYRFVVRVINEEAINLIGKVEGVKGTKYLDKYDGVSECNCKQESTTPSECINGDDVDKLQKTTYIVYATEIILLLLIVVIIFLLIKKAKNKTKEN